eukprot:CFRG3261T1
MSGATEAMFSATSSDRKLLESRVDGITVRKTPAERLADVYEIERCTSIITANQYSNVALQFPDDMLPDAQAVCELITTGVEKKYSQNAVTPTPVCRVFVLGDTTYGSCCIDTVAAEHVHASVIIHYGESCQSLVTKIPVLYVYGRAQVDISAAVSALEGILEKNDRLVVMYECKYSWCVKVLGEKLEEIMDKGSVHISGLRSDGNDKENDGSSVVILGRRIELNDDRNVDDDAKAHGPDFSNTSMLWIGQQGRALTALMLNIPTAKRFISFNPLTNEALVEGASVNKSLMRRYFLVEKCKQAMTVGILVGTLGIAHQHDLLTHMKAILKAAGKKYYTVVIGKVNGPKIANFLEVDAYVLVACPENSMIDSKEFSVPIITPFEMELACTRGREWPGRLRTDLEEVLPQLAVVAAEAIDEENEVDEGVPEFSPLTGTYIHRPTARDTLSSTEIQTRTNGELVAANSAASYMMTRTFKGLEIREGETEVVKAVEGRGGIARGYAGEGKNEPVL